MNGAADATERAAMLSRLRANRPTGAYPLPDVPLPAPPAADDLDRFVAALHRMGGQLCALSAQGGLPPAPAALVAPPAQVFCAVPDLPGVGAGTIDSATADLQLLARVDVAIVPAALAVAETGSVLLDGRQLVAPAVAYLAQHLLVVLDAAALVPDLAAAFRHPAFASAYAVLHTGPSATADIEGVLIHGAQGVRSLTVLLRAGAAACAR